MLPFSKSKPLQPIRGLQTTVSDDLVGKFLEHVKSSPDKLAIMTTERSLTYRELYVEVVHWQAVLGQQLYGRTIVCLDRTPRLLSVLIALQWLNITYIPIDHSLPIGRIQTIIEDSQAQAFLFDRLDPPDYSSLTCLQFNLNHYEQPRFVERASPPHTLKQNSLAYIIYTSGSTGKPKGVAISKSALNNFLASMSRYFLNEEQGLLLAITTLAFDIAVLELFLPLWQKKIIFLSNEQQHNDPLSLLPILNDYPITHLQATPAMWKLLAPQDWQGKSKLVALCGGEPLSSTLAKSLLSTLAELWNMYGPTEATVWCALKQIRPGEPITIGRPIDNTEMCVMDSSFKILPPYVKGELYISGHGLTQGYVNNEDLTRERFIPWKSALGGRLYRVGDIACTTALGEFIIFGRTDNQIKLHGYRIELEEIEAHIQALAGIRACAVNVYKEQLVAYLCLANPTTFSETEFRERLASDLPDYMIPKRFIFLDNLPLSGSGKIAREDLPSPTFSTTPSLNKVTELSAIQLLLARIWARELGLLTLGIHDNFFELGGHSLAAARIALKISQQLGKQIKVNDFYFAPTIAQFTEVIAKASDLEQLDKITAKKTRGLWLPLDDFQITIWIAILHEPKLKTFNNSARQRIKGHIDKRALDLALQLVIQKQDILSYTINRFYPAQKRQAHSSLQWIETSLLAYDEEASEAYLAKSFDALFHQKIWGRPAPMMVAKLFYLKHEQVELQISFSHFISDEDTFAIFFHELESAYHFYANYTLLHAREASYPFISYVSQQNALSTQYASPDAAFWAKYLQDADYCYFPEKYIVKKIKNIHACFSTYQEIPELVLTKLHQFCLKNQVGLSDVLCAAVGLTLQICCTDENCLPAKLFMNAIRTTREDPHYDNVIGCFLRLHSFKMDWSKATLISLSKQIQQSMLETIEYQRAPSLVKIASVGKKSKLQKGLIAVFSSLFSKLSYLVNLNPILLKAWIALAISKPKSGFMINVNIFSTFFPDKTKESNQTLFDLPKQPIPRHPYPIIFVNNIFEICFHRNDNIPVVAITSNLTPAFREYFVKTLLEMLIS